MLLEMFPLIYSFFFFCFIFNIYEIFCIKLLKKNLSTFIVMSPLGCTCSTEARKIRLNPFCCLLLFDGLFSLLFRQHCTSRLANCLSALSSVNYYIASDSLQAAQRHTVMADLLFFFFIFGWDRRASPPRTCSCLRSSGNEALLTEMLRSTWLLTPASHLITSGVKLTDSFS